MVFYVYAHRYRHVCTWDHAFLLKFLQIDVNVLSTESERSKFLKMREDSFKYGMPLLCAEWPTTKTFLVGGGGGSAATGIKNRFFDRRFVFFAMFGIQNPSCEV